MHSCGAFLISLHPYIHGGLYLHTYAGVVLGGRVAVWRRGGEDKDGLAEDVYLAGLAGVGDSEGCVVSACVRGHGGHVQ